MHKKQAYLILALIFSILSAAAQDSAMNERLKVALFAPLYLDSAFDQSNTYKQGKIFPKYINAGLEFYEGAAMAADSLQKENVPLDLFVFDSRSSSTSVNEIIKKGSLNGIDLIIGHVNGNEAKSLSGFAAQHNVPFINANYPNDAGVSNTPEFVILNSTLSTHCAAMYKFIQRNYALAPVIAFRKKGAQEERLKGYFEEIAGATSGVPLKIKYITLQDDFSAEDIKPYLDQDASTVVIAASLDINFANNITRQLTALYSERASVLFGMPTWWDATNFTRPEFKGIEVFYSTPFYISPVHSFGTELNNRFKAIYYSRPTDMFFRGYEALYHFTHLLQLNGKNLGSSLSDKRFKVFTEFDIQPVIDPKTNTLDYFENKKIYFVKKVDGVVTAVY